MWERFAETLDQTFWGNSLWQYLLFCLAILATFIVRVVVRFIVDSRLKKWAKRTKNEADDRIVTSVRKPFLFAVYVIGFYLALEILTLPVEPINVPRFLNGLFNSLLIVSVAWFLFSAVDILVVYLRRFTDRTETQLDDQLIPIVRKIVRAIILALALIMIIQNLGYSVSSLLAGLGLGGLAFALAAKDSLANVFGSVTIFTDRPFQIGDWIKLPGAEGYVEDVGFRSTRIRTFEKTLVTIPNSKLANSVVENMDARPIRRIKMTIGIGYDAKSKQMKEAVEAIREILRNHEGVSQDYWLVYFTDFNDSTLDIFIYYFSKSKVWAEYLNVRQEVNLLIMEKIEELGLEIAFPTQTVYLKQEN
ncbi:MAG: mechanosensitive ion channel family protein [Deltaproteobacteria bacterium]|nr:mechanosensitive ion channel family protein [Deltaproteobacteria bacterium]MBW1871165.1 mechanosensitive ion channel family protein [Deltaproteobacteria bacterium]